MNSLQAIHREHQAARLVQARAVMPMIGPLIDAWEGLSNDKKGILQDESPDLCAFLGEIAKAMEAGIHAEAIEPSAYARAKAFNACTRHPECFQEDVVLNDLIDDIATAIDEARAFGTMDGSGSDRLGRADDAATGANLCPTCGDAPTHQTPDGTYWDGNAHFWRSGA